MMELEKKPVYPEVREMLPSHSTLTVEVKPRLSEPAPARAIADVCSYFRERARCATVVVVYSFLEDCIQGSSMSS